MEVTEPSRSSHTSNRVPSREALESDELARGLTRLSLLRLVTLTLFFGFVTLVNFRGQTGGYSARFAFASIAVAYTFAAIYAAFLRRRMGLAHVAYAQIVTDQIVWTTAVYVTGGVGSGAVSLYGLTCAAGAIVRGARGAMVALAVGIACYIGVSAALIEGVIHPPRDQSLSLYTTTWSGAWYPLFANVLALVIVSAMAGYLAERLRATGGDLARAEARAEEAEQLAGLGRLALGLAHEIRNPLGGILGSVELLRTSPQLDDEDRRLCDIVQREASRLNDLVGDMLDLSRPRPPLLETVDVVRVALDVVELARRSGRGEDVNVTYEGPTSLLLRVDGAQLRQLLWNLVRNGVQASSAQQEVKVMFRSGERGAELSVSDRGVGIDPGAKDKIFDAFFTTRSQGTGVGLAVVKRIVDAHEFEIEVASGGGTTFTVRVPPTAVVTSRASLGGTQELRVAHGLDARVRSTGE